MLGRKMTFQIEERGYARKHGGAQQNGRLKGKLRRIFPKFDAIHKSTIQEAQRTPGEKPTETHSDTS